MGSVYTEIEAKGGDDVLFKFEDGSIIRVSKGIHGEVIVTEITGRRLEIVPSASNMIRVKAQKAEGE